MGPAIFNAILFSLLFLFQYHKKKKIDLSIIIYAVYVIVAVAGCVYYACEKIKYPMSYMGFLYYFVICFILFIPILSKKSIASCCSTVIIHETKFFKLFICVYVVCAIFAIKAIYANAISAIMLGDWTQVKINAYEGDTGIVYSTIERLAVYFISITKYAVILYAFSWLTRTPARYIKFFFFLILGIGHSLLSAIILAFRGGLVIMLLTLIASYLLFAKNIPLRLKKVFKLFLLGVLIIFISLSFSITSSRFGDAALMSLLSYTGQSMIVYNYGIFVPIKSYMQGNYFFSSFTNKEKSDYWVDSLYGTHTDDGSALNTLVGCMYMDFGPYMTILMALAVSCILLRCFNGGRYDLADAYLLLAYFEVLANGVFHANMGLCLTWIGVFLCYVVLKFTQIYDIKKNNYGCNSTDYSIVS